ncbi:MAG: hypothetical protein AB7V56_13825 [Candidatus Nitrosocosmicus sp.]
MSPLSHEKKNITTMEISLDNANKIKQKAELAKRNISATLNEILELYFKKEDMISQLFPLYAVDNALDIGVSIIDRELKKLVDVDYIGGMDVPEAKEGGILYCNFHNSTSCNHVLFYAMILESGKLDIDHHRRMKNEAEEKLKQLFDDDVNLNE